VTRALRLASVNHSPAIRRAPKPAPLISSEARRREAQGQSFYDRANLKPTDLPSTYLALTSYPPRVERKRWRSPVAGVVGVVVGLAVLGATKDAVAACLVGAAIVGGVLLMDGWTR
jgi:hypothetical protein